METDASIRDFLKNDIGRVLVTDEDGEILYADDKMRPILTEQLKKQLHKRSISALGGKEPKNWEFTDAENGLYFRVECAVKEAEGSRVQCFLFTDISNYASLYQEIFEYSRRISDVSDFQTGILGRLSEDYESCLSSLANFCNSSEAILFLETGDRQHVKKTVWGDGFSQNTMSATQEVMAWLFAERFAENGHHVCLLSEYEKTDSRRYAVYLRRGEGFNEEYFRDIALYNITRLFIENGLLREKIIFENEHDHLTGLYNKGKYMTLLEQEDDLPRSIAVYNFDVNDLKYTNDHFGHEAGDRLICKAADSILAVTSDQVAGFRMGGDEFAVIAADLTEKESIALLERWRSELARLNDLNDGVFCVVACGMAYGEGDYALEELMELADVRMYSDKKRLKEARKVKGGAA